MLHHEESPEKPQYNMATLPFHDKPPPFCLPPPFLAKIFRPPPFPSILKILNPSPPLYEGGGVRTMQSVFEKCYNLIKFL